MPPPIQSYQDLLVWQRAMEIAELVYRLSENFPKRESFGLTSQLQRSVVSVASNIAEGHARASTADFLRFISIAFGSLAEVETQIQLARRLGYVTDTEVTPLLSRANEIGKMLRGLQTKLSAKLQR